MFGSIFIMKDFIFLHSWSLFKEHVNEVHPESKNKELVKLHIYAGFETSPKHKVQGKIGMVVIVFITFKYNIHVVLSMMKTYKCFDYLSLFSFNETNFFHST